MIVLPCHNTPTAGFIEPCVASIRAHMGEYPILVVDSVSPDTDYIPRLRAQGVNVAEIANRHYETGAIWYAYLAYPKVQRFYFLHDSCIVAADLRTFTDELVVPGYMPGWAGCDHHQETCQNYLLPQTDYVGSPEFDAIHGSIFFCDRVVLDRVRAKGFAKLLPRNKYESCCMERMWGLALTHEGYNIRECAWGLGEDLYGTMRPITKKAGSRQ